MVLFPCSSLISQELCVWPLDQKRYQTGVLAFSLSVASQMIVLPYCLLIFCFLERSLNSWHSAAVFLSYSVQKWGMLSTWYSLHSLWSRALMRVQLISTSRADNIRHDSLLHQYASADNQRYCIVHEKYRKIKHKAGRGLWGSLVFTFFFGYTYIWTSWCHWTSKHKFVQELTSLLSRSVVAGDQFSRFSVIGTENISKAKQCDA